MADESQRDEGALRGRISGLGAALSERRAELAHARDRVERLREELSASVIEDLAEYGATVRESSPTEDISDAPTPENDAGIEALLRELVRREAELADARKTAEELAAELERLTDARAADQREHARTARLAEEAQRRAERLLTTRDDEIWAARRELDRAREQLALADQASERVQSAQVNAERRLAGLGESVAEAERLRGLAEQAASEAVAERERLRNEVARLEREAETQLFEAASFAADLEGRSRRGGEVEAGLGERGRELEQRLSILTVGLSAVRADIERVAESRAWRYGHGTSRALARLAGRRDKTEGAVNAALERLAQLDRRDDAATQSPSPTPSPAVGVAHEPAGDPHERAALAERIRERLGPPPKLSTCPTVSAVVLNRNGREHLERLIAGLTEATDYPSLELVVVDNASTDGSRELLGSIDAPFPVRVIENDRNATFSEGNNQGFEATSGELVLFLNNDVEPFEPAWLREMVAALDGDRVGAVGATLLHARRRRGSPSGTWRVQHRGIEFREEDGTIRGLNRGDGAELFDGDFGVDVRCPAVTAACVLMRRERFEAVGRFTPGYRYGTEDVDLALKLARHGDGTLCSGRAMLFHAESATQTAEGREFMRLNRLANRKLFVERWGPQLRREYRLGVLQQDPFWGGGARPHIGVTLTSVDAEDGWGDWYTAHEIGAALEARGGRVSYLARKGDAWYAPPRDLDYVLALMDTFDARRLPDGVTAIAWVRNWTERWLERPWLDRIDVVVASSERSAKLVEDATGRTVVRLPLATNPRHFSPREPSPELASDYVFTGNYWGHDRDIIAALDPRPDERFLLFGKDWGDVEAMRPYDRGPIAYERLAEVYSSAKLVIDDTAAPTLKYAAVNARVFDALAAGSLPITNGSDGVHELFDEEFPVWDSRETLRAQLDRLLSDDGERERLATRYRQQVLAHHTYDHRARELTELLVAHEERTSFCVKIGAPGRDVAHRWGDLHYAEALQRELRRRGHRCLVQTLDEWEDTRGLDYDVAIHLKGLSTYDPKPSQLNVLWCISHPDRLAAEECDGYDLIAVASERFAEALKRQTRTPVIVLEQAPDPRVFYPDPEPGYEHELVFVGNSRNVLRPVLADLLPTDHHLTIYGGDWEGLIDSRYIGAEFVPNDQLRHVYSSAGIVLNDHWDDMRANGFIANRVYDALACGALVISDDLPELRERFQGAVITYETREELHVLVERMLANPTERAELGRRGREIVLAGHTFAHRVDELLAAVSRRRADTAFPVRIRAGVATSALSATA